MICGPDRVQFARDLGCISFSSFHCMRLLFVLVSMKHRFCTCLRPDFTPRYWEGITFRLEVYLERW